MFNFKKITCLVIAAAMIVVSAPVEALAEEISDSPEFDIITSETAEDPVEYQIIDDLDESENEEENEGGIAFEGESLPEEEILIETEEDDTLTELQDDTQSDIDYVLSAEEIKLKQALADSLNSFDSKTEGIDYEASLVYAITEDENNAKAIAEVYGIDLTSYANTVAQYSLPEEISVADIIHKAADITNNYPPVSPNYIYALDESSTASYFEDEAIEEDDMSLASVTGKLLGDDRLNESKTAMGDYQWHHDAIGSPYAWANGITGVDTSYSEGAGNDIRPVKIALLSTGVTLHNDFAKDVNKKIMRSTCITNDNGISEENYNEIPIDQNKMNKDINGRGTFLAGVILGIADGKYCRKELGSEPKYPSAAIYDFNIYKTVNSKTYTTSLNIYSAFAYFLDDNNHIKPDIIEIDVNSSNLFETDEYAKLQVQDKIELAYENGITVFVPASNEGGQNGTWLASMEHVICVGATNKVNQCSVYSGNTKYVDIAAPGEEIISSDWSDSSNHISTKDHKELITSAACSVAVAEAAMILGNQNYISALKDKDGKYLTGTKKVDALEKYLKANTISAGAGTGKGIVYLPKALNLDTDNGAPMTPARTGNSVAEKLAADGWRFEIKSSGDAQYIVYTINGKNPTYKDGQPGKDCYMIPSKIIEKAGIKYVVNENYERLFDIELSRTDLNKFTSPTSAVKVIAVNSSGVCSKVASFTDNDSLKTVLEVAISCPDLDETAGLKNSSSPIRVLQGKKLKFIADIFPNNAVTRKPGLKWELKISSGGKSGDTPANKGVTINEKTGVVSVAKNAYKNDSLIYEVTAKSNLNGKTSEKMYFCVADQNITSITPKNAKITKYCTSIEENDDIECLVLFDHVDSHGYHDEGLFNFEPSKTKEEDVFFKSSNPKVISIDDAHPLSIYAGHKVGYYHNNGTATITCYAKDGSGIKGSCKVTVVRNVASLLLYLNPYGKIVRGKSIPLITDIYPRCSNVKKVTDWDIQIKDPNTNTYVALSDAEKKLVKVSGNKLVIDKKAQGSDFRIMAKIKNPDGSFIDSGWKNFELLSQEYLITGIKADKGTYNVFSKINNFHGSSSDPTEIIIPFNITGGRQSASDPLDEKAFEVVTSSELLSPVCNEVLDYVDPIKGDVYKYVPDITTDANGKLYVKLKANTERYGTGKVTVTVYALDGSGKTGKCTVNVINPPSSVSMAPAKSSAAMAVAAGKSLKLKAVLGEGYGKLTNKNVVWEILYGIDSDYATINPKTGDLKATDQICKKNLFKKEVTVRVKYAEDENIYADGEVTIYNWGKMSIAGTKSATVSRKIGISPNPNDNKIDIVINNMPQSTQKVDWDDFIISSSNPVVGYGTAIGTKPGKDNDGKIDTANNTLAVPVTYNITQTDPSKVGNTVITVSTKDGSQKATFTLKVTK